MESDRQEPQDYPTKVSDRVGGQLNSGSQSEGSKREEQEVIYDAESRAKAVASKFPAIREGKHTPNVKV